MKPDLTTANTRVIIAIVILLFAGYMFYTTDKDVGVWVTLGSLLLSAGIIKAFGKP